MGDAARDARPVAIEVGLLKKLRSDDPGRPVVNLVTFENLEEGAWQLRCKNFGSTQAKRDRFWLGVPSVKVLPLSTWIEEGDGPTLLDVQVIHPAFSALLLRLGLLEKSDWMQAAGNGLCSRLKILRSGQPSEASELKRAMFGFHTIDHYFVDRHGVMGTPHLSDVVQRVT
ncbi:MAG: hypothetical protein LQ340_001575 [Diploschistes diacapsis]|nr:MAG: hypothetical protein LQ340_001575 [Diploschistes diacapsis]